MSVTSGGFVPGTAAIPSSLVEITISCQDLADADFFSKSDPMCVTYLKEPSGWREIHRTEAIQNTLSPTFAKKPRLNYHFEEEQKLKFDLYDVDSDSTSLADHDFLGTAVVNLGSLVSNGKVVLPVRLSKTSEQGKIVLLVEEVSSCKQEVRTGAANRRSSESGDFILVHRTEVAKGSLNPSWKKFTIPVQQLCNGDHDRNLKIECLNYNSNGSHHFMGECFVTLRQLLEGPGPSNIVELSKPSSHHQKHSPGQLVLTFAQMNPVYSFLDYIRGGTELQATFAIDFTASNGNPVDPSSLHFIHPEYPSPYARAIRSVGTIIRDYDSDKKFPVLGFGAKIPPHGTVSHEFFVNGSPTDPYCDDIEGVLYAYHQCIRRIQLYGPTNFAPVINHVARFASAYREGSHYFILVIITDGVITDMPQTKEAIVQASVLPMSIIIIGVGTADFAAMEELDADTVPLVSRGRTASRDIVQFVPVRNFEQDPAGPLGTVPMSLSVASKLAKEVLAEIPVQFLSYMKTMGIKPRPVKETVVALPPDPEAPSFTRSAPSFARSAPSLALSAPSLALSVPSLTRSAPSFARSAPSLAL
ncbi:unnamed protein product [Cyprideis torosa]|uniref:Uncharacterized protein n=1 Tax=Cyprideis torosa TaxID=163714 RepID=A0A7R8ZNC2_9CRUS|nr:unnamed protein product [Cyprideis torosa]CAG0897678.1 unnamed protein product [Cyprideis torosa]